jgi:hypothetical protein
MNFSLLCDDPACLPLLWAIARSPEDELVAVACDDRMWGGVESLCPGARRVADWQQLLLVPDVDCVIVSGISGTVLEGARRIASAADGRLLVIFPDVRQTASFAYALWPLAEEGRVALYPALPWRLDPRWRAVHERVRATGRDAIREVRLQREQPAGRSLLAEADVERMLLADADALRWLLGSYTQATCLVAGTSASGLASATVRLSGSGLPEAEWSARPGASGPACRVEVVTDHGPIRMEITAPVAGVQWDEERESEGEADVGVLLLEDIRSRRSAATRGPSWSEVVRAFDVVEAARRSLRRRRTVEIGSEEISERRQFKSHMTAGGCGVLMFTMCAVIGALVFGAIADPRDPGQKRSAAADLIVRDTEFVPERAELTPAGVEHVAEMPARMWQTTAEVLVEPSGGETAELDEARREAVAAVLTEKGAQNADSRTVVRALEGEWFETAMVLVWVGAFAPLGVMLVLQGLIVLARPGEEHEYRGQA